MPATSREFIDVAGARAHVRDRAIPPLHSANVLIHGAGGSLHIWEDWVRELGSKARLISVDLPGHGLTGAWPRHEYTVDAYVDFIEALVDALKLDRFSSWPDTRWVAAWPGPSQRRGRTG